MNLALMLSLLCLTLFALALSLFEKRKPESLTVQVLGALMHLALLNGVWWVWNPPTELFIVYLLPTLYHLWRDQQIAGWLTAFTAPFAYAVVEYARHPNTAPTTPAYWIATASILILSVLMVFLFTRRQKEEYDALLQRATEEVAKSEQAERELRSRYRELAYHYHRIEESLQALEDSNELYSILARALEPNEAYRLMLERLRALSEARGVALLLTGADGLTLRVRCAAGSLRALEGRQTAPTHSPALNPPSPLQQIRQFLMSHLEQMEEAHSAESLDHSVILNLPLRSREQLIGVVSFVSHPKHPFSSDMERRLRSLVPHLTTLVSLYDQIGVLESRLQETQLLQELSSLLFRSNTSQSLPITALETLQPVLRFERAQIALIRGETYEEVANWGSMPDLRPSLIGSARTRKIEALWIADLEEAPDSLFQPMETVRSLMVVPLSNIGSVAGYLALAHSQPHFFTQTDYELAQSTGYHLATILARANLLSHLEQLAFTDGLTGLYNYRYFQERYNAEVRLAKRYQHPLAVMLIDLDGFKQINDQYGHLEGDYALVQLAEVLQQSLRNTELIARYGGDEFVVLLPSTNLQGALSAGVRLIQAVQQHEFRDTAGQYQLPIRISVGISAYPNSTDDPAQLLEIADSALEQAKQTGRNRVVAIENTV